ncbi:TPA: hypothetical protein ACXLW8_004522, partial [Yersinia enterocolitica]
MNNLEEFEIAYNKYTGLDTSAPVERLKRPVPGITYKYQYANDMLAFWNAARAGLIAQLEAAQKLNPLSVNVSELEATYIGDIRLHMAAISDWKSRAKKAEAELSAAQKELFDLHNQEFQQRLANAEHQLYMKDLAIHNIKASRKAQFVKRLAAEYALSAANEKLKGEQVPVASELIPEGMKFSSALPEFVGDSNEISSYRCWIHANTRKVATQEQAYADAKAVCDLFTAPQKPVVLPERYSFEVCA